MKYDEDGKAALRLVEMRAERKMAEIRQMLLPGIVPPLTPDELRTRLFDRMAQLSPAEQDEMKFKAALAMSELERMVAELSQHMNDIGDELKAVNRHSRAVSAYGQAGRAGNRGSARY